MVSAEPAPAAERVRIRVPAGLKVESGLEARLAIDITPKEAIPRQSLVMIRGLPASVTLSAGHVFDSGVWAVRPTDLPTLKIATRPSSFARSELTISLVTLDGEILGNAQLSLAIASRPPAVAVAPAPPSPPAATPTAAASAPRPSIRIHSGSELEEILVLMQKGDENMRDGKVNAARLFYTYAAEKGWAEAALAVAATYDEIELSRLKIIGGVEANADLARQWYERAQIMGAKAADERLQRLSQR
ncbi:hypothetical protein [Rhodomicrobium vannielii]|uniref:hypothetical protein n=1 Tax=Rhodomicrobium vannielii TaxID=1069 RepID=UPI000B4C0DA2|nr:hypothetical protein [Rhodomicrobium vannielii]